MVDSGPEKKTPILSQIFEVIVRQAVPLIVVALLVGTSSPWWLKFLEKKQEPAAERLLAPTIVEQKLLDANVTLSDGLEEDVRGWMRNDPVYQVLAQRCIELLKGKRLLDVVPLDVIATEYKKQFDYGYGQYLPADKWNDQAKLKSAILRGWNIRYPDKKKEAYDALVAERR